MRGWLLERKDALSRQWMQQVNESELRRLQGEALLVDKLLVMIDQGPKIKPHFERGT